MKKLPQSLKNTACRYPGLKDEAKRKFIEKAYYVYKLSFNAIAELCEADGNKIRRDAIKLGIQIRNRSEAQKAALDSGRHTHPTKGKKYDDNLKNKISNSLAETWQNMPEEEKRRRSKMSKQQWDSMTESEKKEFHRRAHQKILETVAKGSKMENFIKKGLIKSGYQVDFHQKQFLQHEKLEVDLYLPKMNTVIEIDGPSHYKPVWGEKTLQKNQQADSTKDGLLLGLGLNVIRIKQTKNVSSFFQRNVLHELLQILEQIKQGNQSTNYFKLGA